MTTLDAWPGVHSHDCASDLVVRRLGDTYDSAA
jgi:hypothetical protein